MKLEDLEAEVKDLDTASLIMLRVPDSEAAQHNERDLVQFAEDLGDRLELPVVLIWGDMSIDALSDDELRRAGLKRA